MSEYDWTSRRRRGRLYQQILDQLRNEVLGQRFQGMKEALQDPADAGSACAEMLQDLNDLLGKHARGEDTDDAFARVHGPARRILPGAARHRRGADRRCSPAGRPPGSG